MCIAALCSVHCHRATPGTDRRASGAAAAESELSLDAGAGDPEELAKRDPLGFLKACRQHYVTGIKDYRCLFTKQERIDGVLSDEQQIEVLFREHPYSVHMRWIANAGRAKRLSYVAGRWARDDGRETALVVPSGLLGLIVPGGVKRDIHAREMLAESRRPIDCFGFRRTLDLIIEYCELAAGDPEYDLTYVGVRLLEGRECYVFERLLPYTGPGGTYPDRLLVVYIDREWLVPTLCVAYADDSRAELLGRYLFSSVEFNTGLTDADF